LGQRAILEISKATATPFGSLLKSNKFGGNECYMGAAKAYRAEMDKRVKELETVKVKGLTIEELAARARLANQKKHQRKKHGNKL
jgi:hypothetical protein